MLFKPYGNLKWHFKIKQNFTCVEFYLKIMKNYSVTENTYRKITELPKHYFLSTEASYASLFIISNPKSSGSPLHPAWVHPCSSLHLCTAAPRLGCTWQNTLRLVRSYPGTAWQARVWQLHSQALRLLKNKSQEPCPALSGGTSLAIRLSLYWQKFCVSEVTIFLLNLAEFNRKMKNRFCK